MPVRLIGPSGPDGGRRGVQTQQRREGDLPDPLRETKARWQVPGCHMAPLTHSGLPGGRAGHAIILECEPGGPCFHTCTRQVLKGRRPSLGSGEREQLLGIMKCRPGSLAPSTSWLDWQHIPESTGSGGSSSQACATNLP